MTIYDKMVLRSMATGKGCILIDDMERNIRDWNAIGGTGIQNINAEKTVEKLKELEIL